MFGQGLLPLRKPRSASHDTPADEHHRGQCLDKQHSTGVCDMTPLRAKGIQSYGIGPASTESDEINYPAHGDVVAARRIVALPVRAVRLECRE